MDCEKIGSLIRTLRIEKHYTQKQLADQMNLSDKTISKWERGFGCPDVSLLAELAALLGVELESLLCGELAANEMSGGNMKKSRFYICAHCGNLLISTTDASVCCCGKTLAALTPVKATPEEKLAVEVMENEYYISSNHEMSKDHYITFVALLTGDSLILKKQYPEWNLQTRLPMIAHGMLLWHCNRHGLFYQGI